jgi:hypothetical protein
MSSSTLMLNDMDQDAILGASDRKRTVRRT